MPAGNLPTPQDAATARRILLDGLARDSEVFELVGELTPLHPRNSTFPGEVLLQVAAGALDWCGASRADPLRRTSRSAPIGGDSVGSKPTSIQADIFALVSGISHYGR